MNKPIYKTQQEIDRAVEKETKENKKLREQEKKIQEFLEVLEFSIIG